jgi:hypothetical protein
MPVTITRTPWIDDDGTGTTGTVINNAVKTDLYNQIDQALAKVPMLTGANTFTGTNTFTGNQFINGVLTVTGLFTHAFTGSGAGLLVVNLRNTSAGSANATQLSIGNDADPNIFAFIAYASNYGTSVVPGGYPNGAVMYCAGTAGLSLNANSASGKIELWTASVKRWTLDNNGNFYNGLPVVTAPYSYFTSPNASLSLGNPGTATVSVCVFANGNGPVGFIQTFASQTAFVTSSDGRLKRDRGIARDTSVLERTEIHDYDWIVDGAPGRGVFSQDAHKVKPDANMPGTDERDDDGRLVRPWSTDYSKYVPDLIVGWQQHRAELAALRAELASLKG